MPERRNLVDAYLLGVLAGFLGAHRFYLGHTTFGFMYLFSFGLLGVGWLTDIVRMPWLLKAANDPNQRLSATNLGDAYLLWFPMGLFGFHQLYLRRFSWFYLYLFTVGLFGCGWLVDAFRMPVLVREAKQGRDPRTPKKVEEAYQLWFPGGLFGFHRFYLGQFEWGLLYLATAGLFGIGWLVDGFRLHILVKEYNERYGKHPPPTVLHAAAAAVPAPVRSAGGLAVGVAAGMVAGVAKHVRGSYGTDKRAHSTPEDDIPVAQIVVHPNH